jgi:hypothetical protein
MEKKTSKSLLVVQDRIEERNTRLKRSGILTQAFKVFRKYLEPIGCTFEEIQKRENGNCHFCVRRPVSIKIETLKVIIEGYGELVVSQRNSETLKVSVSAAAVVLWNTNEQYLIQKFVENFEKAMYSAEKSAKNSILKKAVGGPDKMDSKSLKERVSAFLKEKEFNGHHRSPSEAMPGILKISFKTKEKAMECFVLGEDYFGKGKILHREGSQTVVVLASSDLAEKVGIRGGKKEGGKTPRARKSTGNASEYQRALETLQKFSPKSSEQVLQELWDSLEKKYPSFELLVRTRDQKGERSKAISLDELKKLV